jgi:PST family polysaccharide transporter
MSGPAGGLTQRVLSGFLWMAGGRGATAVAQFLVLAVLARLLTPADFGVVSAAMIVIGFSGIFSKLGLGPALVQRPHLEPRHLQTAATASILFGILVGSIIWAGAPLAASFFRMPQVEPILRVLAWVFPLQGLVVVAESLLLKELQFRRLANLDVLSFTCGYGLVGIICASAGLGVWALVAGHIAQSLLKTTILLFISPLPRRLALERRAFAELMYFGGGLTAAKIANHIALDADNIVVGRWLGTAALGIYGRAYQLMATPTRLFGTALDDVLFPILARVQGEVERLATGYRRSVALVAILMMPSSTIFFVLAPEVVHLALGPGWEEVIGPFRVLAVGILLRTSYKMSDSIARSTGAVYRRAWRQFIYAFFVVAGAWVGQHWGVVGVAFGVLGALMINFVVMAQLGLDITRMSWWTFFRAHLPAALLSAVVGCLVWGLITMLRLQGVHPYASLTLAGASAFALVVLAAWRAPGIFLGDDGRWFLRTLQSLVVGRLKGSRRPTGEARTYAGATGSASESRGD